MAPKNDQQDIVQKVQKIMKRDGTIVDYDKNKIINAILKASNSEDGGKESMEQIINIADKVEQLINQKFYYRSIPAVEEIQDLVEKILMDEGCTSTAKAYILYRQKRAEIREKRKNILGGYITKLNNFSDNALTILAKRYLKKDNSGKIIEKPEECFMRVATYIAEADKNYTKDKKEYQKTIEEFYNLMISQKFMPNTPTIVNAGNPIGQLSACFVLPVEDSMEGIFDAVKWTAIVHKSGGGTGYNFSFLRPKNAIISTTKGRSSGPIEFMKVFNVATDVVKQGGVRRGAMMGCFSIHHPDILDFIDAKSDMVSLTNFNISVLATDKFMQAVKKGTTFDLINPQNNELVGKLDAREVYNYIAINAWRTGDPGMLFIDRIRKDDTIPHKGTINATNPCGEQPLHDFESCNLGSINISKFVTKDKKIDWDELEKTIRIAVHFLDNVIDMNNYPIPQIKEFTLGSRKIGLGIMGFADLLYMMEIKYNSDDGYKIGEKIMKFFKNVSYDESSKLAEKRGVFPFWKGSVFEKRGIKMRNSATLTVAPTGSISMIADCSSGLEPHFALVFTKDLGNTTGTQFYYTNKLFEEKLKEKGLYSEALLEEVSHTGSCQHIKSIPQEIKDIFVTANDISGIEHIKMQAAFQKYTDSAISKTVNLPNNATVDDIKEIYMYAWESGCKGVTIYRDGSRDFQVLYSGKQSGGKYENVQRTIDDIRMLKPQIQHY